MILIFIWFSSGLLAARLRAEAVEISESQFPELYASFTSICQRLNLAEIPRLYVMESGGLLNAFTMRFSGRNFVVIYSDLLEAFGPESDEVRFVIGHEIGHIQRNHIIRNIFIGPGSFLPLIGSAYSRACETTCDRYGAYACNNVDASINAMIALAGGRQAPEFYSPLEFANQHHEERGFFVSVHELASGYPTLSQRVAQLNALAESANTFRKGPRNPLAYPFAIFAVGSPAGGAANFMIMVVIIGLLAAMAIPAFQKVRENSQTKVCINNMRMLESAYEQYALEYGTEPSSFDDLIGPGRYISDDLICPLGGYYDIEIDENGRPVAVCSVLGTIDDALSSTALAPTNSY